MITWLIPNAQKNDMEPILIHIEPGGKSSVGASHDGEEFGYVISGNVYVHLGNKKCKAK